VQLIDFSSCLRSYEPVVTILQRGKNVGLVFLISNKLRGQQRQRGSSCLPGFVQHPAWMLREIRSSYTICRKGWLYDARERRCWSNLRRWLITKVVTKVRNNFASADFRRILNYSFVASLILAREMNRAHL